MKKLLSHLPITTFIWYLTTFLLLLLPILVLPLGSGSAELTQRILFFGALLISTTASLGLLFKSDSLQFNVTPLTLPLLALLITSLLSTILTSPYPLTALSTQGGILLGIPLFALLLGSVINPKSLKNSLPLVLGTMTAITGLVFILNYTGFGLNQIYSRLFQLNASSTIGSQPIGSLLIAAQIAFLALVSACSTLYSNKSLRKNSSLWIVTAISTTSLLFFSWQLLPGKPMATLLPPFTASWSIALDVIRLPRTALLGVGPSNYIDAYTLYRPSWLNSTNLWNISFFQGSNLPLTWLVSIGILGLGSWIWLVAACIRNAKQFLAQQPVLMHTLIAIFLLQLLFPPSLPLLIIAAVIIGYLQASIRHEFPSYELYTLKRTVKKTPLQTTQQQHTHRLVTYVLGTILLVAVFIGYAGLFRIIISYAYEFQGQKAFAQNQAVETYTAYQEAVRFNPFNDELRNQYALINLMLAQALSSSPTPTETNSQDVVQLIQQAIREGRAATTLSPNRATHWQTLGDIYALLIDSVEGSETWSAQVYNQAISTYPSLPTNYVKLGNIFYSQEKYQDALILFERAMQLKPNHVEAYLGAGATHEKLLNYEIALAGYQQASVLLSQDPNANQEIMIEIGNKITELSGKTSKADTSKQVKPAPPEPEATTSAQKNESQLGEIAQELSLTEENLEPAEDLINPESGLQF